MVSPLIRPASCLSSRIKPIRLSVAAVLLATFRLDRISRQRRVLRRSLVVVLALAQQCSIDGSRAAFGAAFFWNGLGATHDWSDGGNWSTGVAPAIPSDYQDNLFFGGLGAGIPYLMRPNLLGFATTGGLVKGMVFLPGAGPYVIQQSPPGIPGFNYEGIGIGVDGLLNQSPNQQLFEGDVFANNSETWNAGTGGLRFNSDVVSYLGPLTITGVGPTGSVIAGSEFLVTDLIKTGTNKLTTLAGAAISSLALQGGTVEMTTGGLGPTNFVGHVVVENGTTLAVTNGATLKANESTSTISIRSGVISVSGATTKLDFTPGNSGMGSTLTSVGDGGAASLTFSGSSQGKFMDLRIGGSSAGTMTAPAGTVIASVNASIGYAVGSTGTATIAGSRAQWNNANDLLVGASGTGSLEIRGGASVTDFRAHVGFNANSSGSVIVSDPGSNWSGTGSFFIGNGGSGSLQILNGATASTSGNGYLGFATFSQGSATVSGNGSTWNIANSLAIGGNLTDPGGPFASTLRIETGGVVNAAATILHNAGVLELTEGATLNSPIASRGGLIRTFNSATHTGNISLDAGNLSVTCNTLSATATLSGVLSGPGGLTKSGFGGSGTLRLTASNTYTGPTTIHSGTLQVDGSIASATTVNSGGTLAGAGTVGPFTIMSGGAIAPGHGVGQLASGDASFRGGGSYSFELKNAGNGSAGSDWDSLNVDGTLDISSLSAASPFNLRLRSLNDANQSAPLGDWNPGVDHTWPLIITTTSGIAGTFDPALFRIDTAEFSNPVHGAFELVPDGNNLSLHYDATDVADGVLVTNVDQPLRYATPIGNNPNPVDPPEGPGAPWYWAAQQFQSDGYPHELVSIQARVGSGSTDTPPVIVAELHADSDGAIGELIGTFTPPDVTGAPTDLEFTPDAFVTLDPGAKYWFVLGSAVPGDGTFVWQYINTDVAAGTGAIGNFADSDTSGNVWNYHGSLFPYYLQVNVRTTIPGDVNGDDAVDAADYVVLRNNPALVQDELDEWRANFGVLADGRLGNNAARSVPEPGPVVLLILMLATWPCRFRSAALQSTTT